MSRSSTCVRDVASLAWLGERDLQRLLLAVSHDGHSDHVAALELSEREVEVVEATDLGRAELDDEVATLETTLLCGAARCHAGDRIAFLAVGAKVGTVSQTFDFESL